MMNDHIDSIINGFNYDLFRNLICEINLPTKDEVFETKLADQTKRNKVKAFSRTIKKVIFNDPAVIIIWKDGTKTSVVCQEGETFDKEKGLALAILKHQFGNIGYYNTIFKEWLDKGIDYNK